MEIILRILLCEVILGVVTANFCSENPIDLVSRVVFGEARGESDRGKLAVAYTIVNRVNHQGFPPSTIEGVVYQKAGARHQYETMDLASHTSNYLAAKASNTQEYIDSKKAAEAALCGKQADPTRCAVNFCADDPCPATSGNIWWTAYNKQKIGNHWFVCLRSG